MKKIFSFLILGAIISGFSVHDYYEHNFGLVTTEGIVGGSLLIHAAFSYMWYALDKGLNTNDKE